MSIYYLLLLFGIVSCYKIRKDVSVLSYERRSNHDDAISNPWTVNWYPNMTLDHFSYKDTRTFQLRYLVNDTFYKPGGPIFFYTGNEGDIEGFAVATGMIWDLAPQFNASIIFAEHRFYGETLPFGNKSYANLDNLGYLTSEQALADYADLLTYLTNPQISGKYPQSTKIIAFGGSYGGMLSAWFAIKYPHIVTGAWASSAPLLYFRSGPVDKGSFDNVTSRTYVNAGTNRYILANCWNAILRLSSTKAGCDFLNKLFVLDPKTPIKTQDDGWNLNYFLREAIEYMAMVDYPYPANFLSPMPGWPATVASSYMSTPGTNFTDEQLATYISQAAAVYYNYTGTAAPYCINSYVCGDTATAELGSPLGWPWQECTEIIMDMCARGGDNDVFWDECGTDSLAGLYESCQYSFGNKNTDPNAPSQWTSALLDIYAVPTRYGMTTKKANNIILTQGHLDPWSSGGFKTDSSNYNNGIYVMEIPGSAHHLDLRTPNTCDPNTVHNARYQIVNIIACWVTGTVCPSLSPLPDIIIPPNTTVCQDINYGYPWNQVPVASQTTLSSVTATVATTASMTATVASVTNSPSTSTVQPITTSLTSYYSISLCLMSTLLYILL